MKYILMLVWAILVVIYMIIFMFLVSAQSIILFLWDFKIHKIDWKKETWSRDFPTSYGYDKNPYESFIRILMQRDYKNHDYEYWPNKPEEL